ncbi:MAG: CpaF family protein [Anaerolineales bacterium]
MNASPAIALNEAQLVKLRNYLTDEVNKALATESGRAKQRKQAIQEALEQAFAKTKVELSAAARAQLFEEVIAGLGGLGRLQPLIDDNSVTEIMVNGPANVFVERAGKLEKSDVRFDTNEQVIELINNIIRPLGRTISFDYPSVDARLPDGSRVNAIIPPVAIDGPSITIRKFPKDRMGVKELVAFGSITENMAAFLDACVKSRLNIIISGGTGSGKTTLLNILSGFIPEKERIVTIEDAAELQLQQEHVVRLEVKTADVGKDNEMNIRALVRNALRMRPDRIVVGEVRGAEALDMLQAMNTGHDGSLTTVHSNSPRDAVSRLETLVLMAGLDLPVKTVRQQIASAVDLIIQQSRFTDGTRKVSYITEVAGMEGDMITMTDVFTFEQTGTGAKGEVLGALKATGLRPILMTRLKAEGHDLGAKIFSTGT